MGTQATGQTRLQSSFGVTRPRRSCDARYVPRSVVMNNTLPVPFPTCDKSEAARGNGYALQARVLAHHSSSDKSVVRLLIWLVLVGSHSPLNARPLHFRKVLPWPRER